MLHPLEIADAVTEHLSICSGRLVFEGFEEADPAVVDGIAGAENPEAAAHAFLQIGARASTAAGATLDSLVVERAFDGLSAQFDASLTTAIDHISGQTTELLDDERGRLPAFLRALEGRLADQFGALFDEDSKSSALAAMTRVFEQFAVERDREFRRATNPSDPDTALGRMKQDLLASMKEHFSHMLGQVAEIAAVVGRNAGRAEITEVSPIKGRPYEESLVAALGRQAARHGDSSEAVGEQQGASGRKIGDVVVRLAPSDCVGEPLAVLFEAKNRSRHPSMRKVHDELDAGMANRQAVVGIAVFPTVEVSPSGTVFATYDNKAIAVFAGSEEDELALELAYLWARTEARRRGRTDMSEVDIKGALAALDDARRVLDRIVTVKRYLGGARCQLEKAGTEVDGLRFELREALDEARSRLEPPCE